MHIKSWLKKIFQGTVGAHQEDKGSEATFHFSLDSPTKTRVVEETFDVIGWFFSKQKASVYIEFCNQSYEPRRGISRHDVERAFTKVDKSLTKPSGFQLTLPSMSGDLLVYVLDEQKNRIILDSRSIIYEPELLVQDMRVFGLDEKMAEHRNLLESKKKYYFEVEYEGGYKRHKDDVRLIAFYLPQFHPVPENDKAWGKGFTEWTNVTAAEPRFIGHQQPLLPGDLGFYDLRNPDVLAQQITLARKFGLYGFCFYFYWFSGKQLLEKPLDIFLEHKEWDFNFMICWANENWTKRWDGMDSEVIMAQHHNETDPLRFIKDVERILTDPRYIRVNGKPVLMVYRPSQLGNPQRYVSIWREYMKKEHGLDLHIISSLGFDEDVKKWGFDCGVEFEPLTSGRRNGLATDEFHDDIEQISFKSDITRASYRKFIMNKDNAAKKGIANYTSIFPSWDNDARKKGKESTVFYDANPDSYAYWLNKTLNSIGKRNQELVFVNAWNEWAEGAVLEPRSDIGFAYLNRTVEVLSQHSKYRSNKQSFPMYGIPKTRRKIAVIIHLYYPELWPKIAEKIERIGQPYDLFVSLPEKHKTFKPNVPHGSRLHMFVVPNRGRDVLPFLQLIKRIQYSGYTYVLKLHSKKSLHRSDGEDWLDTTLDQLLPDTQSINKVIKRLSNPRAAYIGPESHHVNLMSNIGSNEKLLLKVLSFVTGSQFKTHLLEDQSFFAGTMFWARLDTLQPIIDASFLPDDFEPEKGQIDATLAHAIERSFLILAKQAGKRNYYVTSSGRVALAKPSSAIKEYKYVQPDPKV